MLVLLTFHVEYFYLSKPIFEWYPIRTNNHELEWAVLAEEDENVVIRNTADITVYILFHAIFLENQFYVQYTMYL